MVELIGWLRNLVQLKILMKLLGGRYGRIIKSAAKLIFSSVKLILVSINYLTALILIPAIVFYITHLISKDYLIPVIVSVAAIVIYLIIMSSYFNKGVHKFGDNAKDIKQMYHIIRMEHKLTLKSLKDDIANGRLITFLAIIIALEFIFFYNLAARFDWNANIKSIVMGFVVVQIIFVLVEYTASGYGIFSFRLPKLKILKKEKKKEENILPSNYMKMEDFDDLIIEAEHEEDIEKKKSKEEE